MKSISEAQRAKMFMALSGAIGVEEAEVLSTALNLDGQLATRDELVTSIMAVREEIAELKAETRSGFASMQTDMANMKAELRSEIGGLHTEMVEKFSSSGRTLFFQLAGLQFTLFGFVMAGFKLLH